MAQKNIFVESEGDAWFNRNQQNVASRKLPEEDFLLREILEINTLPKEGLRVLEVGCGDGSRLAWLMTNLHAECYGIEPSAQAVAAACSKGVHARQGTADHLPFEDHCFDIVIFGFCLYLCDREDLFRIACEADRVTRSPGWVVIQDFFSPTPRANIYHHCPNVQSHKMDYRSLFSWHPGYECMTHKIRHHSEGLYTDEHDEWVALSVIRKLPTGLVV
jgi:ubiquinone/menaquinone biosynthesis C-methylase UbiE